MFANLGKLTNLVNMSTSKSHTVMYKRNNIYHLMLLCSLLINLIRAQSTGNTLVNCAACQMVQVQDWSCDVSCQVIRGNNGMYPLRIQGKLWLYDSNFSETELIFKFIQAKACINLKIYSVFEEFESYN